MAILLETWKEIARFFGVSERKMKNHRAELQAGGWVYYRYSNKARRRIVCAFETELLKWIAIKTSKGEML